jgi:hypothetical protein
MPAPGWRPRPAPTVPAVRGPEDLAVQGVRVGRTVRAAPVVTVVTVVPTAPAARAAQAVLTVPAAQAVLTVPAAQAVLTVPVARAVLEDLAGPVGPGVSTTGRARTSAATRPTPTARS